MPIRYEVDRCRLYQAFPVSATRDTPGYGSRCVVTCHGMGMDTWVCYPTVVCRYPVHSLGGYRYALCGGPKVGLMTFWWELPSSVRDTLGIHGPI